LAKTTNLTRTMARWVHTLPDHAMKSAAWQRRGYGMLQPHCNDREFVAVLGWNP
jgi:hypothetical protein